MKGVLVFCATTSEMSFARACMTSLKSDTLMAIEALNSGHPVAALITTCCTGWRAPPGTTIAFTAECLARYPHWSSEYQQARARVKP